MRLKQRISESELVSGWGPIALHALISSVVASASIALAASEIFDVKNQTMFAIGIGVSVLGFGAASISPLIGQRDRRNIDSLDLLIGEIKLEHESLDKLHSAMNAIFQSNPREFGHTLERLSEEYILKKSSLEKDHRKLRDEIDALLKEIEESQAGNQSVHKENC